MSIYTTISKINRELISSFAALDSWFDLLTPDEKRLRCGLTPMEILERISIVNQQFILEKASMKACERSTTIKFNKALKDYRFRKPYLDVVDVERSFEAPQQITRVVEANQLRTTFRHQLHRCLVLLDLLSEGEGIQVCIQLPVWPFVEVDLYQGLYFIALQTRHHEKKLTVSKTAVVDWLI
jgi:hypothetical protein